jgi:protocatechuate 3,4-dioxygenase beta subunit
MPRRRLLALGATSVAGSVVFGCSSDDAGSAASDGASSGAGGSSSATNGGSGGSNVAGSGTTGTAGESTAGEAGAGAAGSEVPWATGGTAAMTAQASYPNPFGALPSACSVTCALTEGPCYSADSVELQDISYGRPGLPLRLYLRILDEACTPMAGAQVDVWHTSPEGIYSGNDAEHEDVAYCTGNDEDFETHLYFRGKQTTDDDGIAYFDTCFPGWYSGRTIHIHLTIRIGDEAYVTTQFAFDDALDDSIVASQPIYEARGERDTKNTSDGVFPAADIAEYTFETAKMSDGAMLAWKTIILRSSLDEAICSPSGSAGGPMGGPPPSM